MTRRWNRYVRFVVTPDGDSKEEAERTVFLVDTLEEVKRAAIELFGKGHQNVSVYGVSACGELFKE